MSSPEDGLPAISGSLQAHGGAIADVAPGDSAFSRRDTTVEFVTMAGWEDAAEDEGRISAHRRYADAMEPYASGAYVNGLADEASGLRHAYTDDALKRLTGLKDRYDPENAFHLNHNVRPSTLA